MKIFRRLVNFFRTSPPPLTIAQQLPHEIKLMIFEQYVKSFKGEILHIAYHRKNELAKALRPLFVSRDIWRLGQELLFELVIISGGISPAGSPYSMYDEPRPAVAAKIQHYELQIDEQPKQIDLRRLNDILFDIGTVGHLYPNLRSIHIKFLYASTKPILLVAENRLGQAGYRFEVSDTMEEVIGELQRVFGYRKTPYGYSRSERQTKVDMFVTDGIFNQQKASLFLWGKGLGSPALRGIRMRIPFDDQLAELANISEAKWATAEQGWRTFSSRPYPSRP